MHGAPLLAALVLAAPPGWHHPLALGTGGLWRQRVPVTVQNAADRPAMGTPVSVTIGSRRGEANIAGAEAGALRICDAAGNEMLFDVTGLTGAPERSGQVKPGARITFPAECPANGRALYFIYFDNSRAWPVRDFLPGSGDLRNGGLEIGTGDVPDAWVHDVNDADHRTAWVSETPRSGKRCLRTTVRPGAEATWIATRQSGIRIVGGARYSMTAWVRAEGVLGEAGWYIHVGNEQNIMQISPMLPGGSGTYPWKEVRADFTAPADADRADLGTVLRGTGTAWFDDVELRRLDRDEKVTAAAGAVEQCGIREERMGPWWSNAGQKPEYRAPISTVNLTAEPSDGLIGVNAAGLFSRLHGRAAPGSVTLVAAGRRVPTYRIGDMLLFPGQVPARTVRTYAVYAASKTPPARSRPLPAPSTSAVPVQYAPNPAVPGGLNRSAAIADRGEYARLLASPRNLARNASFETGAHTPAEWLASAEGEKPAGADMQVVDGGLFGQRCAQIRIPASSTPAWTGWRQDVAVRPGRTYLYAAWLRCRDLVGGLQIHAHMRKSNGELASTNAMVGAGPAISGTQAWTLVSGQFTTPPDCTVFQVHLTMLATGAAYHDGVIVAEVTPGEIGAMETLAPSDTKVRVWPVNSVVKVFREDVPPRQTDRAMITCARGEWEPVQWAVRSGRSLRGVRVEVLAPRRAGGGSLPKYEIGVVGYVPIDHATNYYSDRTPAYYRKVPKSPPSCDGWSGWWPDPLLPTAQLDLRAGVTQPVWVTFRVPDNAPAGEYRGAMRLLQGQAVLAEAALTVRVWGYRLPSVTHFKAVYDTRQGGPMWEMPGKTADESRTAFWRFMSERRVCPDTIRPEPSITYRDGKVIADFSDFDRAARVYFDELKFPHAYTPWSFYCFGWGHLPAEKFGQQPYEGIYPFDGVDRSKLRPEFKRAYQACLKAYWDHVKANGWADRITLYISDEPNDALGPIRDQMTALCNMIHEVDPAIPIYCSTWHHQPEWDGKLNVWGIGHYGLVSVAKMRDILTTGATIWWTTDGQMCTDTPYCAIERLLPHYCLKYGAEAYEFWGIDWLTYNPYETGWHQFLLHDFGPGTTKEYVRYPNGDGFLAYPPRNSDPTRPVSSVRLEQAREGVEDYESMVMLRDLVARGRAAGKAVHVGEKALALADRLVTSPCEIGRYSTRILPDPDRVLSVKAAVGRAIERLLALGVH